MKIETEPLFPNKEIISMIENSISGIKPDTSTLNEWHNSYVINHKNRIALDLKIVNENIASSSKILEFGSIPLMLTAPLVLSEFTITGIDIDPSRYQTSIKKLGVNVIPCDIENMALPLESNTYDAVIFFEIFEHLRINPIFTISEILRVLKPNGTLLLSSPNLRSYGGIKNFLLRNRGSSCSGNIYNEYKKLEMLGHMGHVREYTSTEIIEFLTNVGFKVDKLIYRGSYASPFSKLVIKLFPTMKPFITYVSHKPEYV